MEREVIHLNVTAFPIGVARVVNPALRERPVVVALPSPRAVVLALSREAYLEGVVKGMSLRKARQLCPGLRVTPPDEPLYRRAARAVYEHACQYSPLVEPGRPGHLHLDLTGSRRLLGPAVDAAARIQREVRDRLRLRNTVGVASNKLVSRAASRVVRPRGVCDVFAGFEAGFLAPLPVEELPGVGDKTAAALHELNLWRTGEVAALAAEHLGLAFGPLGHRLHRAAQGIDETPVRPPDRTPLVREEQTLAVDDNDDAVILAVLYLLIERAGRRLRESRFRARRIKVEVFYSDHVHTAREQTLDRPTDLDGALFAAARELLERAWTRRVRLRHLSLDLTGLTTGPVQLGLFDEPEEKDRGLNQALDAIRARYGTAAVSWGRTAPAGGMDEAVVRSDGGTRRVETGIRRTAQARCV